MVTLLTRDQVRIGWLLGYAINGKGVLLDSETVTVSVRNDAAVVPTEFEHWIYDHGGRFIVVLITETLLRVYLDPCGYLLSAIYCPILESAASTVSVIHRNGETEDLTDLARLVGVPASSMYPLN